MEPAQKILAILEESEEGLTIQEIAQELKLNRNSTAKYLEVLKTQRSICERCIGPAKLYTKSHEPNINKQLELYKHAMDQASCGISIADMTQEDAPLIYVNKRFEQMTGYTKEEVLGRNCRFLQQDAENTHARKTIREALKNNKECDVTLTNYTKNGEKFTNHLRLAPITNQHGETTHYIGIQSTNFEKT